MDGDDFAGKVCKHVRIRERKKEVLGGECAVLSHSAPPLPSDAIKSGTYTRAMNCWKSLINLVLRDGRVASPRPALWVSRPLGKNGELALSLVPLCPCCCP